jgi:hypothetical protein
MADDKTKTGKPDRDRINTDEAYEVRDWAKRFGVSEDALKTAVQKAGPMVKHVAKPWVSALAMPLSHPVTGLLAVARRLLAKAERMVAMLEAELGRGLLGRAVGRDEVNRILALRTAERDEAQSALHDLERKPRWQWEQELTAESR